MSLQAIYYYVGIAGIALCVVFAVAAAVYFFKADIKNVLDDLSGKGRADSDTLKEARLNEASRQVAQAEDAKFAGEVVKGSVRKATGKETSSFWGKGKTAGGEDAKATVVSGAMGAAASMAGSGVSARKQRSGTATKNTIRLITPTQTGTYYGSARYIDANGQLRPL